MWGFSKRNRDVVHTDHEKMARLEQAEAEVAALKARADKAINYLEARSARNHWKQAVIETIQGV